MCLLTAQKGFFDNLADAIVTGREDAYTGMENPTD
jgi:hypothetical protein